MFNFRFNRAKGAVRGSLIILVAAIVTLFVAATLTHGTATTKSSASHEIAPIDPTCTSSSPCIEYDNNGAGPGIRGISVGGNGLAGATKFNSTSPSDGREGLIGNDISTSGIFNAGVRGLSTRGEGVAGQSINGPGVIGVSSTNFGVKGTSTNAQAVVGVSTNAQAVEGISTNAQAVEGISTNSNGVEGGTQSSASSIAGVQGDNGASSIAVRANGSGGPLFVGNNSGAVNVFTVDDGGNTNMLGSLSAGQVAAVVSSGDAMVASTSAGAEAIFASNSGAGGHGADLNGTYIGAVARAPSGTTTFPLVLTDGTGANVFFVNGNGDVFYHGTLNAFAVTRTGKTAIAYSSKTTSPTVEDTGSGQLINGVAMVALDAAFAQTIDPRVPYHVMLTPDGDTRGLFVASKGPNGFVVREVQGGRGSLTFDYHIYAPALGHPNDRMAVVTRDIAASIMPKALPTMHRITRPAFRQVPKSPRKRIWGN